MRAFAGIGAVLLIGLVSACGSTATSTTTGTTAERSRATVSAPRFVVGDSIEYKRFDAIVTGALRSAATFHDETSMSSVPGVVASDDTDCRRGASKHQVLDDDAVSVHGDSIFVGGASYFRAAGDTMWQKDSAPAWATSYLCSASQVLDLSRLLADGSFKKVSAALTFDVTSVDSTGTTFTIGHRNRTNEASGAATWTVKLDPRGRPATVVTPVGNNGGSSTVTFSKFGQPVHIAAPMSTTSTS